MKKIMVLIYIAMVFASVVAQPYYFWPAQITDSSAHPFYRVMKINLATGQEDILSDSLYEITIYDQTQTWIVNGEGRYNIVLNIGSREKLCYVPYTDQILYSRNRNKLYLFGLSDDGVNKPMAIIDLTTKEECNLISLPGLPNNELSAFFSADESTMYYTKHDTSNNLFYTLNDKLVYYSTITDTMYKEVNISQFGYPNVDGYILSRGRQGIGIVESFFYDSSKLCYYRVCNFDVDSTSQFISDRGYGEAYAVHNSSLLIVLGKSEFVNQSDSTTQEYYTGRLSIYDVKEAQLLKTRIVPGFSKIIQSNDDDGTFYCLTSLDSTISYFKVSIDSILSSKDNLQISPAITFSNTSSFTLEVVGKGFTSASRVLWNDSVRTTTFMSDSLLRASILAADVATVGDKIVRVKYDSTSSAVSDSMVFSVVNTLPKPVRLVIEKEIDNHNGTMTAWFGYLNVNDRSVYIPVGDKNSFTPTPIDRGQATIFLPGRHKYVFGVSFPNTINIEWQLNGRRAKAGSVCEN